VSPETKDTAEGLEEQVAAPSDTYRFKVPVKFGDEELIEEVTLRANGRAMQGFKVETTASGGVVFEPYRFAEQGLKLAGKPRAVVDRMHPCDQFGLGMVALAFFTSGPGTGSVASP
jgi:hypothetical protein